MTPSVTQSAPAAAPRKKALGTATLGYAGHSATTPLVPFTFERREPGPHDVQIEILYCGVCHSDLHQARNEWGTTEYPIVPGHEIVGRVVRTGGAVAGFRAGDLAAVGCMVESCGTCPDCREGLEQFCQTELTFTYNSPDKHTGKMTYGGYSNQIVVDERFVLRLSDTLDLAGAAPLLCAGITSYYPCATGRWAPAPRSALSGWAGSVTWG